MRVWRLCRKAFAADPLGGRGGLFTSGRWNGKERRIVYTSGSLALAALEMLVHVDREMLPPDLVQLEIDVPDTLAAQRVEPPSLPKGWRSYPGPAALQRLGDDWLAGLATAALRVPSAVIPEEPDFLINPVHADTGRIRVISMRDFGYDRRLGL